jgi:pyrimidine operon attenuation protein/uracil phosphoribosyltransferase
MPTKTLVLDNTQIEQRINRIAYELYENNYEEKNIIMAGIAPNGYVLAQRIAKVLQNISPIQVKLAKLVIDKDNPFEKAPSIDLKPSEMKNKVIVLVDDVLNSGKTMIYGAKLFLDAPVKRLATVVLVDRNHTRYPVKADFSGISLSTTLQEHIAVELGAKGKEAVYLL